MLILVPDGHLRLEFTNLLIVSTFHLVFLLVSTDRLKHLRRRLRIRAARAQSSYSGDLSPAEMGKSGPAKTAH